MFAKGGNEVFNMKEYYISSISDLGKIALEVRLAKNISMNEIMDISGIDRHTIHKFEQGGSVNAYTLFEIYNSLGIQLKAESDLQQ